MIVGLALWNITQRFKIKDLENSILENERHIGYLNTSVNEVRQVKNKLLTSWVSEG